MAMTRKSQPLLMCILVILFTITIRLIEGQDICSSSHSIARYIDGDCLALHQTSGAYTRLTWDNARAKCHQGGGNLVIIQNRRYSHMIEDWLKTSSPDAIRSNIWIGLSSRQQYPGRYVMRWDNGQIMGFRNFRRGFPPVTSSRRCVLMRTNPRTYGNPVYNMKWFTVACTTRAYFICHYKNVSLSSQSTTIYQPTMVSAVASTTSSETPTTSSAVTSTSSVASATTNPVIPKEITSEKAPVYLIVCNSTRAGGRMWPGLKLSTLPTGATFHQVMEPCPNGTIGDAFWNCGANGYFPKNGPDLSRCKHEWIKNLETVLNKEVAPDINILVQTTVHRMDHSVKLFPRDLMSLPKIMNSMVHIKNMSGKADVENVVNFTQGIATIGDMLFNAKHSTDWDVLGHRIKKSLATEVTESIEEASFQLARVLKAKSQRMDFENIDIKVVNVRHSNSVPSIHTFTTPDNSSNATMMSITTHSATKIVFASYQSVGRLFGNPRNVSKFKGLTLNSLVVSASLHSAKHTVIFSGGEGMETTLKHVNIGDLSSATCVYWDTTTSDPHWSDHGCHKVSSNVTHTICKCDHLTSFAVLMDTLGATRKLSEEHMFALSVITYVGLIVSIICLFLCIVTFVAFRGLKCIRNTIHINLCICLFISELLFLFGVDKTQEMIACSIIAGILHFFFLAAFFWMLLEGIQLYMMVIKVFDSDALSKLMCYGVGYGCPVVIVGVSAAIRPSGYGTDEYCWLETQSGFIWTFVGPVALIILTNLVILAMVMRRVTIHKQNVHNENRFSEKLSTWTKGAVILTCLLGSTWVFGLLYLSEDQVVLPYIFTILNSTQGMFIFLFHCALNPSVQAQYRNTFTQCCPGAMTDRHQEYNKNNKSHIQKHAIQEYSGSDVDGRIIYNSLQDTSSSPASFSSLTPGSEKNNFVYN